MKTLNRHDLLLLLGTGSLFTVLSFGGLSLLIPRLLSGTQARAMADDLTHQAWVLQSLKAGDVARVNPGEQPLRIWPGPLPPRSSRPQGGPEQPLLLRQLATYNIRSPLRCQPLPPWQLFCGYWLQVDTPNQSTVWVFSAPSRALPWLWPLIRTASLLIGCGAALALFLYRRVQLPITGILERLPNIPTEVLELVPEQGIAALQELSRRINRCLSQLNEAQETRRRLLQGLAHDLGSPLTRLSMRLEALEEAPELATTLAPLRHDLNTLINLTHQLQDTAGLDQPPYRRLPTAVDELCERLAASYPNQGLALQVPRLIARIDPSLVERALCNLVDNAYRHGRPPVRLSALRQHEQLVLKVEDAGDGLPSSLRVMPRIAPAHDRQQTRPIGHGLAVVERCCQLHGGRLLLNRSKLGGLLAELHLPMEA